jgi:hypothetical protein
VLNAQCCVANQARKISCWKFSMKKLLTYTCKLIRILMLVLVIVYSDFLGVMLDSFQS